MEPDQQSYWGSPGRRWRIRELETSSRFYNGNLYLDRSTRRLATAILDQAIRDVLSSEEFGTHQVVGGWRQDALKSFTSNEEDPGSLQWVSGIIEVNAEDIRKWVRNNADGTRKNRERWLGRLGRWRARG